MSPPAPSTAFAAALLEELVRRGVRHLVVAPGSRSQALALVAAELERVGRARLHVRIDERSAAFLALGIGLESGAPAAVITTSGSAVANLHPAVLEAHHAGVPLLVITADRPAELHGIGANQTTTQAGVFGAAVRGEWDVPAPVGAAGETARGRDVAAAAWAAATGGGDRRAAGPVHVNVALAEPLSSPWSAPPPAADPDATSVAGPQPDDAAPTDARDVVRLAPDRPTAVIAGDGAGPRAEEVARALGAVLLAEAVSGAHYGPNLVVPYREVIRDGEFLDRLARVVVFGHPTLSREVPWLIERGGVELIGVRGPGAEDYNPGRSITRFADDLVVEGDDERAAELTRSWVRPWVAASRAFLAAGDDLPPDVTLAAGPKARHELAAVRRPVTRRALAEAVWRATWPHDRLVLAASRLIREVDRTAPGKAIRVHANRGLAGIDGTVSTALGVALAQQHGAAGRTGVTRVLLGDLAFLHDVGGLALPAAETPPRILVVVGDDGGGTIFDLLEAGRAAREAGGDAAAAFDRVLRTPQAVSIAALASAYGWEHRRVANRGELDPALSSCTGPTIVEVPLAD